MSPHDLGGDAGREMGRHIGNRIAKKIVAAIIFIPIFIAGFGWAVYALWNWLMPPIFGLPSLTFWQSVGLLALSWLLFGRFRGFGGGGHHGGGRWQQRKWIEKWEAMTPEEREAFKKKMEKCGRWREEKSPPLQS